MTSCLMNLDLDLETPSVRRDWPESWRLAVLDLAAYSVADPDLEACSAAVEERLSVPRALGSTALVDYLTMVVDSLDQNLSSG